MVGAVLVLSGIVLIETQPQPVKTGAGKPARA
jgi:hypothetical protein